MCFSPQASFIASGGLGVIGVIALRITQKSKRLIALIPLFFAIQQASEGVQWLYVGTGETSLIAAYFFLFFGFLLWPVYVPIAIYVADRSRRHILQWFVLLGACTSVIYLTGLVLNPLHIEVIKHSIHYNVEIPFADLAAGLYLVSVLGALFTSHSTILRWDGVIVLAAAAAAQAFYAATFASVWCFFSAIVSSLILWYVWRRHRKTKHSSD
jgi:hypothetical protein